MTVTAFDHVNLRTANLDEMGRFYRDILGLQAGERPPFNFGGAWLYCGDLAVVHLVEVAEAPATREPRLEHFAFRAAGLGSFLALLSGHGVAYETVVVPGMEIIQVNFHDPDGNHIHVDFQPHEKAALDGAT
jgi:catechol 2,3-dioxygenase-like lactoylglutathione lyase family enzyme